MKKIILCFQICSVLMFSPNILGQSFDKNKIEAKIDSLIPAGVNDSTPGLVVGVMQKGELVFSKGYGLANISYGIENDPKMVYNLGSVSKQFLGYAFAMLHVKGDLNIDDPVSKYLDDWPEFEHKVTLRHLLTHSSGYREAYTMSSLAGRTIGVDRLSREECLEVVRKQPELEFVPGSRYTYNSTAWVILAEVLEKVTGTAADEWVKTNILQPLDMHNTQIEGHVGDVILNAAESYTYNNEIGYTNQDSNRAIFGAAEVYANLPDLTNWINNFKTAEVGGKEVHDMFFDPFILSDGSNSEYALGIRVSTYRGLKRYRHTGGHEAFLTQLSYFPEHDLGIVVISNYGGRGSVQSSNIADLLLEDHMNTTPASEKKHVDLEKEQLEQFTGVYLSPALNNSINLTMGDNSLMIDGRTELIATSQNTFGVEGWSGEIQIENPSEENARLTIVDGTKQTFNRVKALSENEVDLDSFKGDYWSEELETIYHLKVSDEKLIIQHRWLDDVSLTPVSKDFFESDRGIFIKFERDATGNISGFNVNSGRTLNVFFQRKN